MSVNPYTPPQEPSLPYPEPIKKGFRPLAIVAGVATDYGTSFVVGVGFSIVYAVVLLFQNVPQADLLARMQGYDYLIVAMVLGLGCSLLGGFVAGKVARHSEVLHGAVTGIVSSVLSLAFWTLVPTWHALISLILVTPTAMLGGYLARRPDAKAG